MVWLGLIPLFFGCITLNSNIDTEVSPILWFILAVLIYGVFK